MYMKKKLLAMLLVIVMLLGMLPVGALAAEADDDQPVAANDSGSVVTLAEENGTKEPSPDPHVFAVEEPILKSITVKGNAYCPEITATDYNSNTHQYEITLIIPDNAGLDTMGLVNWKFRNESHPDYCIDPSISLDNTNYTHLNNTATKRVNLEKTMIKTILKSFSEKTDSTVDNDFWFKIEIYEKSIDNNEDVKHGDLLETYVFCIKRSATLITATNKVAPVKVNVDEEDLKVTAGDANSFSFTTGGKTAVDLTCTATMPDKVKIMLGETELTSGIATKIELSPFEANQDGIRTIALSVIPKNVTDEAELSLKTTHYTLLADDKDHTPVINSITATPYQSDDKQTLELDQNERNYKFTCEKQQPPTFTVNAEGENLSYQWCAGLKPIEGATDKAFTPPADAYAGSASYRCIVINTIGDQVFKVETQSILLTTLPTYASGAKITSQTEAASVILGQEDYKIYVDATPLDNYQLQEKAVRVTSLQWYHNTENSYDGANIYGEQVDGYYNSNGVYFPPDPQIAVDSSEAGISYYYCVITVSVTDGNGSVISSNSETKSELIPVTVVSLNEFFEGNGTKNDPFLVKNADDLEHIRGIVAGGNSLSGFFFKMTDDITLPVDWKMIGTLKPGGTENSNGRDIRPFSGTLDGDGHTLTVPEDGFPLFRYVREATVENLIIYGTKIAGAGLVNRYCIDYGSDGSYNTYVPDTIHINNVTLKTGSSTRLSGFIHGNGSGQNGVYITNSVIESGVTIGYDHDQDKIGSFAGCLNGQIINCVSAADVYGVNVVGGIAGAKGQSMGDCRIFNCAFTGTVTAKDWAAGILASGYYADSAPNTPGPVISNCYVSATITAEDYLAGIYGLEPSREDTYTAGVGSIACNVFYGKLETAGTHVGAIAAYYKTYNQSRPFIDCYFVEGCGAERDIGSVGQLNGDGGDFGKENLRTIEQMKSEEMVDVLNASENGFHNWLLDETTGYPVIDQSKAQKFPYKLTVSGLTEENTSFYIGDDLNLSMGTITLQYADDSIEVLAWSDVTTSGYDKSTRGTQTVTISYQNCISTEVVVTVLKRPVQDAPNTITVYFTLMGDDLHDSMTDGKVHTLYKGGLKTWVSRKAYTVDMNATVWDVVKVALDANGYTYSNPTGNYIESITTPTGVTIGEFTNGPDSGWMYTLNEEHTLLGISEQYLDSGNRIVLHYTDDYTKEKDSEQWTDPSSGTPSSSDKDDDVVTSTEGTTVEVTPEATVTDGEAKAEVSSEAITSALTEAAKDDTTTAIVIAPEITGDADKVTVEIPKAAVSDVANSSDLAVTVSSDVAEITVTNEGLTELAKETGSTVTVSAEKTDDGAVKVEVAVGSKVIDEVAGGLTVGVPATEDGNVLVIVDAEGNETVVKKSLVDDETAKAIVDGSCTVKVVDNSKDFSDVKDTAWYAGDVDFASSHELFQGVSTTEFAPETEMTRAMLATVLYRLEDAATTGANTFADVTVGTWYNDAVTWANGAGIVQGYSATQFGANDNITREQLATMLYRYAKTVGMDTGVRGDMSSFNDTESVSDYADEAVRWAVGSGIIGGKGNGVLDPKGNATRAEVAAMLQRLVKLMVK